MKTNNTKIQKDEKGEFFVDKQAKVYVDPNCAGCDELESCCQNEMYYRLAHSSCFKRIKKQFSR